MTLALLFLMGYPFWQDTMHEWVGTGMFLLFILHHVLNKNWYHTLFQGKYTRSRVFQLILDLLVFLTMVGLMISGVMLSNHVFDFLPIHGGMSFARLLHMAASYWGFVLMAMHLGLHWSMFLAMGRKALKWRPSATWRILLPILGSCVAVYGLIAFVRRNLLTYMLLRTHFAFFDFSEPILRFYLDYLAMMGTFIFVSYYISKFLKKKNPTPKIPA